MRICSPQLGLSPTSILGGEIYDRQILKYLAKSGVEVEILLPLLKQHEDVKGWKIHRVPIPFVIPPHLYNFLVLPQLFFIYKKYTFDILRIHSPTFLGLAAQLFKKVHPTVPIVGTYHWIGEGGVVEKMLDPLVISVFDCIICDSFYTKDQLEQKFPRAKGRVHAIHNGVDEKLHPKTKSRQLLEKFNLNTSSVVMLFMGLMIERKNPLYLLPIMKNLVRKHTNIYLILCGEGPLSRQLEIQIRQMQLNKHVRMTSPVFGEEKNELLNLADIFVHPAKQEGFSLAVIEAMAVGLPVVITDGFSASEAVTDGENGYLCKSKRDWEDKLSLLIRYPRLRIKFRHNNLGKVKHNFTWKRSTEKQLFLYKQIISQQR